MEIVGGIMHQWHHGADPVPLLRVNTVRRIFLEFSKNFRFLVRRKVKRRIKQRSIFPK